MMQRVVSSNNKNNVEKESSAKKKDSNNSADDESAYYSSLAKANADYWNNLSPEDQRKWSQWQDRESRANDPYQNGYYNRSNTTQASNSNN